MRKDEAKFQGKFNSWLRNVYKRTGAYELKQTPTDSIPYRNIETHQITALLAVKRGTFAYKISDESIGFKPFDCFCLSGTPAYVVILYKKSRTFYLIDIDNLIFYRDHRAKRKSLTEKEAKDICHLMVEL